MSNCPACATAFNYNITTIEDVVFRLIEPNELGTTNSHYLRTSAGRVVSDNMLTLSMINMNADFDDLENSRYGMPCIDLEICNRFGSLAH